MAVFFEHCESHEDVLPFPTPGVSGGHCCPHRMLRSYHCKYHGRSITESKGQKDKDFSHQPGTTTASTTGATSTPVVITGPVATSSHSPERRASSVRDVAMAGHTEDDNAVVEPTISPTSATADAAEEERQSRARRRSPSPPVSPLSDDADDEATVGLSSPSKGTQDTSEEPFTKDDRLQLAPPPVMAAQRTSDSPVRDSKFLENL